MSPEQDLTVVPRPPGVGHPVPVAVNEIWWTQNFNHYSFQLFDLVESLLPLPSAATIRPRVQERRLQSFGIEEP